MSHVTFDIGSGVAGGSVETRVPREVLVGSIKINVTVERAEGLCTHEGDRVTPVGIAVRGERACLKRVGGAGRQAGNDRRLLDPGDHHFGPGAGSAAGERRPSDFVTRGALL